MISRSLLFSNHFNLCCTCGASINHLGVYVVGLLSSVSYLLCKRYGKQSRTGLSQAKLALIDECLGVFAVRAGLAPKEVNYGKP